MRYGRLVLVAMVAGLLFAGCGDDNGHHHEDEDDFIVSHPSSLETFIERGSGRAFDVVEVGVTPFTDQFGNPEPYVLEISGIAASDGTEIIFEAEDFVTQEEFFDPLEESVVDALITCDCFVDYVVLRDEFGEVEITFD